MSVEVNRHIPPEWDSGPLGARLSHANSSSTGSSLPLEVNETWLAAIQGYKAIQEAMHDALRSHLLAAYQEYRPYTSESEAKAFLADKELRKGIIARWRDISIHKVMSEKATFWEVFRIRSLNFHTLTQDLLALEQLFEVADSVIDPERVTTREYVMAKDGDTILEFANSASEIYPILRFRVSSHLLAAVSPLFSQMFSPSQGDAQLDMVDDLPPPPTKHTCEDKTEVKVYRMPQFEQNDNNALTILLDAAHMRKHEFPNKIDFETFVSVAEVCLRYRCLPVLIEFQVRYLWLRQWLHMLPQWLHTADESSGRDGLLLISYVFSFRGLFARMSKSAVLNAADAAEIENKIIWPRHIREKLKAIRAAKMAQIHACCTNAIGEYFRPPQDGADRSTSVGSLTLTNTPRCPKRSHLCDATNLGWLMLVYNELRVLPTIMSNVGFRDLPEPPGRSLKELLDCLRLMPSPPEVHSGVCDYAPTFRSAINDIYNSVSGLRLDEVSSVFLQQDGPESTEDLDHDPVEDVHELETIPSERAPFSSHEAVCLRILSYLDDIDDLNSAAVINRGFYGVYKKNEAALLKNVMRAKRRRATSIFSSDIPGIRDSLRSYVVPRESLPGSNDESWPLVADNSRPARYSDLYDVSPPLSPTNVDAPMTDEEALRILWPDNLSSGKDTHGQRSNGNLDRNAKYLLGGVAQIEDKARIGEGYKQLRDDKDKALGLGVHLASGR
jgi:hypothetical protein